MESAAEDDTPSIKKSFADSHLSGLLTHRVLTKRAPSDSNLVWTAVMRRVRWVLTDQVYMLSALLAFCAGVLRSWPIYLLFAIVVLAVVVHSLYVVVTLPSTLIQTNQGPELFILPLQNDYFTAPLTALRRSVVFYGYLVAAMFWAGALMTLLSKAGGSGGHLDAATLGCVTGMAVTGGAAHILYSLIFCVLAVYGLRVFLLLMIPFIFMTISPLVIGAFAMGLLGYGLYISESKIKRGEGVDNLMARYRKRLLAEE